MFGALKPRNLWRRWWDSTPKHHRFPDFPGRIPKSEVCWAAFQVFDKDCNGTVSFEELEQVLNSASMEGWPSPCRGSNQRMGSFMVDHHFIYQFLSFSPSSTFAQTDAIAIYCNTPYHGDGDLMKSRFRLRFKPETPEISPKHPGLPDPRSQ